MPSNPITDLSFWKARIKRAKESNRWWSVYLVHPPQWRAIEKAHKAIIEKEAHGKVLDAGCGYGRICEWIDDYTGVDFSPDFIEWAKELYPDKTFIQADLKNLPFKDKEFDCAVAISIKEMVVGNLGMAAWEEMEKELMRVAKKVLVLKYIEPDIYEIL